MFTTYFLKDFVLVFKGFGLCFIIFLVYFILINKILYIFIQWNQLLFFNSDEILLFLDFWTQFEFQLHISILSDIITCNNLVLSIFQPNCLWFSYISWIRWSLISLKHSH